MHANEIGRRVNSDLASLIRQVGKNNPSKSVSLTVCHLLYHSSPELTMQWRLEIGHGPAVSADSFEKVVALEKKLGAPEHKLVRAAKLRVEADQLEAAAKLQSQNPTSTPPFHA